MILFLYGPDTYRSRQKLNEIIAHYKTIHISGLNFKVFSAEDNNSFEDFKNCAQTTSMFGEKKLIVMDGAANAPEFMRSFRAWQARVALKDSRDVVCVFYDGAIEKKGEMLNWMKDNSEAQEFAALSGSRLLNWVRKYAEENHIKCDQGILWRLVAISGGDLWRIVNELKRLKTYKRGDKITSEDLDTFSEGAREKNVFNLADALVSGNKSRALKLLSACADSEDEARRIFGLLCWKMRTIVQGGRFDTAKLKKAYSMLIGLDIAVKTGRFSAKYALESFIFET